MSAAREFRDGPARERIVSDLDASIIVEAGAGTGKTSVLVGRIVSLVRDERCSIGEIAAITFTEAAADELRSRVYEALVDELARTENAAVRRALAELDDATITTIHGFAERILRDHVLDARLPLRIEVLDEVAAARAFEGYFARLAEELYATPRLNAVVQCASLLGMTTQQLQGAARCFFEDIDAARAFLAARAGVRELDVEGAVRDAVGSVVASLSALVAWGSSCIDRSDLLFVRLEDLRDRLEGFAGEGDFIDELLWLQSLTAQQVGNIGRRDSWQGDCLDEVKDSFVAFEAVRREAQARLCGLVIEKLGSSLAAFAIEAGDERRRAGTLSFSDLLVCARDLVAESAFVRRSVQRRSRCILVDEFQDTDPAQLELILALGRKDDGDDASALFFVGDPRQSIYSFRGADVALYEMAKTLVPDAEVVELSTNFRSTPAVLGFVNAVFSHLVPANAEQPSFTGALDPARESLDARAGVVVLGGAARPPQSASVRRQLEALDVADAIKRLVDEPFLVDDGGLRPARLSDIAILVPRRTGLRELERALTGHGLSYRLQSSTLIYESAELHELLSCLSAIEHPGDERALLAALRSSIFAVSDVDLAGYAASGGEWRIDDIDEEHSTHPVGAALGRLRDYHAAAPALGIIALVDRLVREEQVRELYAAARNGDESLRRLDFFVDRVRRYVEDGGSTIGEFLATVAVERGLGARRSEPPMLDDADAIRILTIHGAKGLEFPIVVLAELGGSFRAHSRGPRILRDGAGHVELRASATLATPGFSAAFELAKQKERDEALRLLYVGATRARDHLLVSVHHASTEAKDGSLAEMLFSVCENERGLWSAAPPQSLFSLPGLTARDVSETGERIDAASFASWRAEREELLAELARPRSIAASAIDDESDELGSFDDDVFSWPSRKSATSLGRAVHAILQRVDLDPDADIAPLAVREAHKRGIASEQSEIERLVRAVLSSRVVASAAASRRCYRELPLAVRVGDGVLECVLDLCFEEDDGFVIVDYKTDRVAEGADIASSAERYRMQAGAYALSLFCLTGQVVKRVVLVFASPAGGAIEYEIPALEKAVSSVQSLVSARFSTTLSH